MPIILNDTATCTRCDEPLHRAISNDYWIWVGRDGRTYRDDFYEDNGVDIYSHLASLQKRIIAGDCTDLEAAEYSRLSAATSLGMAGHTHQHVARPHAPHEFHVPTSSGEPCHLRPSGWYDRITGALVEE